MTLFGSFLTTQEIITLFGETTVNVTVVEKWLNSAYALLSQYDLPPFQEIECEEMLRPYRLGMDNDWDYHRTEASLELHTQMPITELVSVFEGKKKLDKSAYQFKLYSKKLTYQYAPNSILNFRSPIVNELAPLYLPENRLKVTYISVIREEDKIHLLNALRYIYACTGGFKVTEPNRNIAEYKADDVAIKYGSSPTLEQLYSSKGPLKNILKPILCKT